MSIVIALTKQQTKQAYGLHSKADLASLRLLSAKMDVHPDPDSLDSPLETKLTYRARNARVKEQILTVEVSFSVRAWDSQDTNLFRVSGVYQAGYSLAKDYKPTKEEVKAFTTGNAIFNCWSHWREFVQNSTARMGLAAPPLPFLRLAPRPADQKKRASHSKDSGEKRISSKGKKSGHRASKQSRV